MSAFTDPLVWVAITGGITGAGAFLINAATQIGSRTRFERRIKLLLDLLPNTESPGDSSSLRDKICWLEAIAEFDELTRPRPKPMLGWFSLVTAVLLAYTTLFLLVAGLAPTSTTGFHPDGGDRTVLIFASLYALLVAVAMSLQATSLLTPAFQLGGRRLKPGSRHVQFVRKLRRDLKISTSIDERAYRTSRRIANRTFRTLRALRRARHPRAYLNNVRRAWRRQRPKTFTTDRQALAPLIETPVDLDYRRIIETPVRLDTANRADGSQTPTR
ncbi:hypothetical protein WKY82_10325 [Gordonia malaquae]|uniref:hypothetical protein n=1 Tax=Gordonia malaquae TaxID=410332 RepID=UPI0030C795F1